VTSAGLESASTGKVTVTIEAPKGVPANVALAGPAKALFAKPVAGQARRHQPCTVAPTGPAPS
jgi:hypothetical protein